MPKNITRAINKSRKQSSKTTSSEITTSDTSESENEKSKQLQLTKAKQALINDILNQSQLSREEHRVLINQLINFIKENNSNNNNNNNNRESSKLILNHLIESLKKVLTLPKSEEVNNYFKFLIEFSIVYYSFQKSKLGQLIDSKHDNKQVSSDYKSFLYSLIENVLLFSQNNDFSIRSNSIYFLSLVIYNKRVLPLLDFTKIKSILKFLKKKTNDKINIKCNSIKSILIIIKYLDQIEDEELIQNDQDIKLNEGVEEENIANSNDKNEIVKKYLKFIVSILDIEESFDVRKTILLNLPINKDNYQIFITRLMDNNELVSKQAAIAISTLDHSIQIFNKQDIQNIILNGLESRYTSTKKEITSMICNIWMKNYFENDLEKLIKYLYISNRSHDNVNMNEDEESIIRKVLFTLFLDGQSPNQFSFKNSILLYKPITDEFALLYKLYFEFLLTKDQDYQDYLPPISNYLYYFKQVDEFAGCGIFEIIEKENNRNNHNHNLNNNSNIIDSSGSSNNSKSSKEEESLDLKNQPFVFQQLILILNLYSDEVKIALFKTYHLERYFLEILKSLDYSIETKDIIVGLLRNSLNSKYFYDSILNCISKILATPLINDKKFSQVKIQSQLHSLSIISNILKNSDKIQEENIIYLIGYINELLDSDSDMVKEKALECYGSYCLLDSISGNYQSKLFNGLLESSTPKKTKMLSYLFDILLLKYHYLDVDYCIEMNENCFNKEISKLLFILSQSIINSNFILEKEIKEIFIEGISKLYISNIINTSSIFYNIMVFFFKKEKDSDNSYQVLNQFFKHFPISSLKSFNLFLKSFKPTINYYLFSNGTVNPKIIETIVCYYQSVVTQLEEKRSSIIPLDSDYKNKFLKIYLKSLIIYLKTNEKNQINLISNIINKFEIQEKDSINFKKIRVLLLILDECKIKKNILGQIQILKNTMDYLISTFKDYKELSSQQIEEITEEIDGICSQRLEDLEKSSFEAASNTSSQDPFNYINQINDDDEAIDDLDNTQSDKEDQNQQILNSFEDNHELKYNSNSNNNINNYNSNESINIIQSQTSNSSSLVNNLNSDIDINDINNSDNDNGDSVDFDTDNNEIDDNNNNNQSNNNNNNKNKCIIM